jgi:hypothetical protein
MSQHRGSGLAFPAHKFARSSSVASFSAAC